MSILAIRYKIKTKRFILFFNNQLIFCLHIQKCYSDIKISNFTYTYFYLLRILRVFGYVKALVAVTEF